MDNLKQKDGEVKGLEVTPGVNPWGHILNIAHKW